MGHNRISELYDDNLAINLRSSRPSLQRPSRDMRNTSVPSPIGTMPSFIRRTHGITDLEIRIRLHQIMLAAASGHYLMRLC